jgi:anti-anti-sigma factor
VDHSGLFDVEQQAVTQREVMLELQRAMLPAGLPVLPDINLAAGYRPADLPEAAGGDWFDVVLMPGDEHSTVALMVGDVVGHGATASAVMGQLRAVALERLRRGSDLAEVLRALDTFADSSPSARGGTICLVLLDRETGSMQYAVRGHPPPLLVAPDGASRYLTESTGPPLALPSTGTRLARATLGVGETLVLYSNGAVAQPGRTVRQGMRVLAERAAGAALLPAGEVAEQICDAVTECGAGYDDVVVLAASLRSEPPDPLSLTVPAVPERLGTVRKQFANWLTGFRPTEDDQVALELSVIEAVTNSIEHAYAGLPGVVRVDATLARDGTIRVTIGDDGRWKPPLVNPGFRGRGIMMMREFSDTFRLDISTDGTSVTLAKALHRPTPIAEPQDLVLDAGDLQISITVEPADVIVSLAGMLDSTTVARLHSSLLDAERLSSLPLTIVLDKVTLLASAALRTLYEHAGRLISAHRTLRLVVAPTSPARDVLAVSGLDQLVEVVPRFA